MYSNLIKESLIYSYSVPLSCHLCIAEQIKSAHTKMREVWFVAVSPVLSCVYYSRFVAAMELTEEQNSLNAALTVTHQRSHVLRCGKNMHPMGHLGGITIGMTSYCMTHTSMQSRNGSFLRLLTFSKIFWIACDDDVRGTNQPVRKFCWKNLGLPRDIANEPSPSNASPFFFV